jgi:hypothetical protein
MALSSDPGSKRTVLLPTASSNAAAGTRGDGAGMKYSKHSQILKDTSTEFLSVYFGFNPSQPYIAMTASIPEAEH